MKVPLSLVLDLTRLVTEHLTDGGLYGSPVEQGYACGERARRWLADRGRPEFQESYNEAELVAWAERYGKHLGVFFSNERSH